MSFSFDILPRAVQEEFKRVLPGCISPRNLSRATVDFRVSSCPFDSKGLVNGEERFSSFRSVKIAETQWGILSQGAATHPDG